MNFGRTQTIVVLKLYAFDRVSIFKKRRTQTIVVLKRDLIFDDIAYFKGRTQTIVVLKPSSDLRIFI